MKLLVRNLVAAFAIALTFTACSSDDDNTPTGQGSLKLEFDNVYKTANLAFNTTYTNTNGEVIKVAKAKYIVSNIVLTKADGSTYTVPKNESYFIIDEATAASTLLTLPNIPAANYTKVSFGIGVDQEQFLLGADGQGNFLATAQAAGMMWSWSAGYKFVAFEGSFTSSSVTTDTTFMLHTGKTGTDYNYATVALDLPENALVRTNITPQVHIMADLAQLIDGTNKINFAEGAMVMGGAKLALVTANIANVFEVHHVHND